MEVWVVWPPRMHEMLPESSGHMERETCTDRSTYDHAISDATARADCSFRTSDSLLDILRRLPRVLPITTPERVPTRARKRIARLIQAGIREVFGTMC